MFNVRYTSAGNAAHNPRQLFQVFVLRSEAHPSTLVRAIYIYPDHRNMSDAVRRSVYL
jgi:hypothetical protein